MAPCLRPSASTQQSIIEESNHLATDRIPYGSMDQSTLAEKKGGVSLNFDSGANQPACASFMNKAAFVVALIGMIIYCVLLAGGKYFIWATPLLATGSICSLISTPASVSQSKQSTRYRMLHTAYQRYGGICTYLKRAVQSLSRILANDSNHDLICLSITTILIPCTIYFIKLASSHIPYENGYIQMDESVHSHLANDFGKLSVTAMSYFLIPVSRHSTILQSVGINPSHAVRLHIWAGLIAFFGGLAHGLYWTWIWIFLHQTRNIYMILPDKQCFVFNYDHNCHTKFVNLLGIICGLCFVGLGLSSMWWVRRNHYRVFYICHVLFSLILLFGLLMHYNKVILYLAPGLLYYTASSIPVWVEGMKKWWQGGVGVSKVTHIADSGGCVELSFRLDSNIASSDLCGSFVRLCVPEVSGISHPFTVFSHPKYPDEMKIILRSYGPFTTQLSNNLRQSSPQEGQNCTHLPRIVVDGLYGGRNQLHQALNHDSIIILAGGVGIVSYISLISSLQSILCPGEDANEFSDGDGVQRNADTLRKRKRVHVHWICRDEGLIDHVVQDYFPLSDNCSMTPRRITDQEHISIDLTIHHTRSTSSSSFRSPDNSQDGITYQQDEQCYASVSSLYVGGKSIPQNIISATTFSCIAWGGLWIIQYCYHNIQEKQNVEKRLVAALAILAWATIISITSLIAVTLISSIHSRFNYSKLSGDSSVEYAHQKGREITDDSSDSKDVNSGSKKSPDLESQPLELSGESLVEVGNKMIIRHSQGRPHIPNIIGDILEGREEGVDCDIGFFMCGPAKLLQTIRGSISESESRNICSPTANKIVAVYEEKFEM